MQETIFEKPLSIDRQIYDISNTITLLRSEDTLRYCKLYKFGKFVFGIIAITPGSTLQNNISVATGFPKPYNTANGTPIASTQNIRDYRAAYIKDINTYASAVELTTLSGNNDIGIGYGAQYFSIFYICE